MRIHLPRVVAYLLSMLIAFTLGYFYGKYSTNCKKGIFYNLFGNSEFNRQRNLSIATDTNTFSSEVTVILYDADEEYIKSILQIYPQIKILLASGKNRKTTTATANTIQEMGKFPNKALALNALMKGVKTTYFLYLDSSHSLEPTASNQSVGWLLHAAKQIPLLDIIGGSILEKNGHHNEIGKHDKLEIPCYRLHHYNWSYSETYEYSQSIGDVMVCERTSTSFLAKTNAGNKITFDQDVGTFIFEDFFLRAKELGIQVATKPEVYFVLREKDRNSSVRQSVDTTFDADTFAFGLKHQVLRIGTVLREVLNICDRFSTVGGKLFPKEELLCDYDKAMPYWKIKHWSPGGMFAPPTMIMALQRSLKLIGLFLDKHNYPWSVFGGCSLGSVKMRAILPWDAGDIDIWGYTSKQKLLHLLRTKFEPNFPAYEVEDYKRKDDMKEVIIRPRRGFGGWITIFIHPHPRENLQFVRMNMDGYYAPVQRSIFYDFRKEYGVTYLQHEMYLSGKVVTCGSTSNACLPDFTNIFNSRGGTFREFFDEKYV